MGTTTTADSTFNREGTYCSKNVVVSVGATTILCYEDISSIDMSGCDKVEFDMYSSIAITASTLQIHLSSTAAIASAEETINIPAMDAGTWYRHSLSLANPHSDTAIISVGIYQVTNLADFTFYIDNIIAVDSTSRVYRELPDAYWGISKGTTPYLQISTSGLVVMGTDVLMKLTGHKLCSRLDADATSADIDPQYIIDRATARLLTTHADRIDLDPKAKAQKAIDFWNMSDKKLRGMTTNLGNTKAVN